MIKTTSVNNLPRVFGWLIIFMLVLVPFHAFITVWISSLTGHYILLRLWKEFVLAIIALGAIYKLIVNRQLRRNFFDLFITKTILAYTLLLLICGFVAYAQGRVTAKALSYGLLVDLRFLVLFLSVVVVAAGTTELKDVWKKMLLVPAILVAAFAILQYLVLPYDFLKHFGYGDNTISPYETINHNIKHLRVASTLRGANPLGAYLLIPLSALTVLELKERKERVDKLLVSLGLVLALIFSFSRSAWIGLVLTVATVFYLSIKRSSWRKSSYWVIAALAAACIVVTLIFRNNLNFENVFLHTDKESGNSISSNEGHAAAFKYATQDIKNEPLGRGVGTAGPQSIYNQRPIRIAEDYFLQIGQEAGILGMLLFIAICIAVGRLLYGYRQDPLALALLASLIGLTFVNLLSHAWEDDTLAYVWWGLAGIACAPAILTDRLKDKNGTKAKTTKKDPSPVR